MRWCGYPLGGDVDMCVDVFHDGCIYMHSSVLFDYGSSYLEELCLSVFTCRMGNTMEVVERDL